MGIDEFLANLFKMGNYGYSSFGEEDRTAGRTVSGLEKKAELPHPIQKPSPYVNAESYPITDDLLTFKPTPLPVPQPKPVFSPWEQVQNDAPWWHSATFDKDGNLPFQPDDSKRMHKDNWRFWNKPIPGSPGNKERDFFDPILDRFALVESKADPKANYNKPHKAGGMYQFTPETAKEFGLRPEDRFDPVKSRTAARRLLERNTTSLSKMIKRMPQPHEIYLSHQQGAGGAASLINRPNMNAVDALVAGTKMSKKQARKHILNNHGTLDMTSSEFIELMGSVFYDGWYMKDQFFKNRKAKMEGEEI